MNGKKGEWNLAICQIGSKIISSHSIMYRKLKWKPSKLGFHLIMAEGFYFPL